MPIYSNATANVRPHGVRAPNAFVSNADTLGTKATVRFREVSALERAHVTWYPNLQGFLAVYNEHMTDRLRLF